MLHNIRLFTWAKTSFDEESKLLQKTLTKELRFKLPTFRYGVGFDIYQFAKKANTKLLVEKILIRPTITNYCFSNLNKYIYILAKQSLPGKFCQRDDSATKLAQLFFNEKKITIQSFEFLAFKKQLSPKLIDKIKTFWIKPLDSCLKDCLSNLPKTNPITKVTKKILNYEISPLPILWFDEPLLRNFYNAQKFHLDWPNFKHLVEYFKQIQQNPNLLVFRFFEVYWSDHCRHTTMRKAINKNNVHFSGSDQALLTEIQASYKLFCQLHKAKEFSLFDLILINNRLNNFKVEQSNAATIPFMVGDQKYLFHFKNETHNHPTEIEPYGGAATCLGGAVRDILANLALPIAGMRISASSNILNPYQKTPQGKLPQAYISKTAAVGFSSYGNQIGLPTAFVHEYYATDYWVKHLECGATIGVSQAVTAKPTLKENDLVLLIGGLTGLDGLNAAVGSSQTHTENTLTDNLNEVQKGNPLIKRAFLHWYRACPNIIQKFKASNDFGAGGAAIAISELVHNTELGIELNLDRMPTKQKAMNAYQLLFSESQERMAYVIDPADLATLKISCQKYNLQLSCIGKIQSKPHFSVFYQTKLVLDLPYKIIHSHFLIPNVEKIDVILNTLPKTSKNILTWPKIYQNLSSQNQKGLALYFDQTINNANQLSQFSGTNAKTSEFCSVIDLTGWTKKNYQTPNYALISVGFEPSLNQISAYHMGFYSVLDAINRLFCRCFTFQNISLCMQEYFPSLTSSTLWAKPLLALLGAFKVIHYFKIPVIGGKDSMSGTYHEQFHVPSTLISFAIQLQINNASYCTSDFKKVKSFVYVIYIPRTNTGLCDLNAYQQMLNQLSKYATSQTILACSSIHLEHNILWTLANMSFGNEIGIDIDHLACRFIEQTTGIGFIFEYPIRLQTMAQNVIFLGQTINKYFIIRYRQYKISTLWEQATKLFETIYSIEGKKQFFSISRQVGKQLLSFSPKAASASTALKTQTKPKVLILVFYGTNCEFDVVNVYQELNIVPKLLIINSLTMNKMQKSVQQFIALLAKTDILILPGGFAFADEPNGSGKIISFFLSLPKIKKALQNFIQRQGLIWGICNGFQGLLQSGLLENDLLTSKSLLAKSALLINKDYHHLAKFVYVKFLPSVSHFITSQQTNQVVCVPISHGEGRFYTTAKQFNKLFKAGQIVSVYASSTGEFDLNKLPTNPNGSYANIESICSANGLIYGCMAHHERILQIHAMKICYKSFAKINLFKNSLEAVTTWIGLKNN